MTDPTLPILGGLAGAILLAGYWPLIRAGRCVRCGRRMVLWPWTRYRMRIVGWHRAEYWHAGECPARRHGYGWRLAGLTLLAGLAAGALWLVTALAIILGRPA